MSEYLLQMGRTSDRSAAIPVDSGSARVIINGLQEVSNIPFHLFNTIQSPLSQTWRSGLRWALVTRQSFAEFVLWKYDQMFLRIPIF